MPIIKEIFVAGLTVPDLEQMLTERFREFNTTADISAEVVTSSSKWYYIDGEVAQPGRKPFEGETTLFRAVFDAAPTILSDVDSIRLIRPDPYHPLRLEFDYDDMLEGGWSLGNAEVRENDIIYVPPNVFGYLTIFTQRLFSPLTVLVQSVFDVNRLLFSVDTFGDTDRFRGRRNNFYGRALPGDAEPLRVASGPEGDG
jgi:protein involved in polysaccharide export with SLBB domain